MDWQGLLIAVASAFGAVIVTVWTLRGALERSLANVNQGLALLTQKVDLLNNAHDERVARLEAQVATHDQELRSIRNRIHELGNRVIHPEAVEDLRRLAVRERG